MDDKRFLNDINLKDIAASLHQYDVVSFDVFDTLLFRTVDEPVHVFRTLGESIQQEYTEYMNTPIEVLCQLRITAEQRARKKAKSIGKDDVTLEEIYKELHIFGDRIHRIIELEQLAEQEHVYANPNMYSFAEYCYEQGKQLAIVSDFYFSKAQLTKLLNGAGINTAIFSVFLVSSEHTVTKGSGKLFRVLLDSFPKVQAGRILHIGDNYNADIISAQDLGIQACWYPVVPETRRGIIDMERCCYGSTAGTLSSLRSLAMNTIPESITDDEDMFWFRTGSGILGPVLTLYAEWVVDTAINENIEHVLAFMREGELLAELIKRAAANRNVELKVTPFFISRMASSLLTGPELTKDIIEKSYLERLPLFIGDLFLNLYLDIEDTVFAKLSNLTLYECKSKGCFEEVAKYLLLDSTISQINEKIAKQREYLADYTHSQIGNNAAITVDFICTGTIQRGFSGALKSCGHENRIIHLILAGSPLNIELILDGIDIRGYLGYAGVFEEELKKTRTCVAPLEVMIASNMKKTIAYKKEAEIVTPVFKEVHITEYDKDAKSKIWDGIYWFQACLFYLKSVTPKCTETIKRERKAISFIISRMQQFPLNKEAIMIGALAFDDGVLFSHSGSFVEPKDLEQLKLIDDNDAFLVNTTRDGYRVFWPHAVVEQAFPNYFLKKYLNEKSMQPWVSKHQIKVLDFLLSSNELYGRIGLYGFGIKGKRLLSIVWPLGLRIDAIIDKSCELHGQCEYGVKIISPEQSVSRIDSYIISTPKYSDEIKCDIEALHVGKKQPGILVFDWI
jgi:predicted HAD superfamily hydrolase